MVYNNKLGPFYVKNKNQLYYKMSEDLIQPRINLKEQPTIVCGDCGGMFFKEVTLLKKVSKILTGAPEDTIVPFPTYMCSSCNFVNEEFQLFEK